MGNNTIVSGSGNTTLVFIHYFGGSALSWQWLIKELDADYPCIAFYLPGFGGTVAPDAVSVAYYASYIKEQLSIMGVSQYIVVGHSMGGKIAAQLAYDDRSRISQAILLSPSPPSVERMPEDEKKRMLHHPDVHEAEVTVKRVTHRELSPERFQFAVDTQLQIQEHVWRWWILEGMGNSIADKTMKLRDLPIAVLMSEEDAAITPQMIAEDVMPNLPSATTKLYKLKEVGHLSPLEDPEQLAALLRNIIQ